MYLALASKSIEWGEFETLLGRNSIAVAPPGFPLIAPNYALEEGAIGTLPPKGSQDGLSPMGAGSPSDTLVLSQI